MIDIQRLKRITHIVTHGPTCSDGIASAMVLREIYPKAKLTFLQPSTKEFEELPAEEGMLFCDISPPFKRWPEFFDVSSIVLDHHKKSQRVTEAFSDVGLGYFADEEKEPGVSGATLAGREVYAHMWSWAGCIPEDVPLVARFAQLMGIRDTWQRHSPDWQEASQLAYALDFMGYEQAQKVQVPKWFETFSYIGGIIEERHKRSVARGIEGAVRWDTFTDFTRDGVLVGLQVVILQAGSQLVSDVADQFGPDTLTVGFNTWKTDDGHPGYKYSLRTRGNFDCGAMAAFYKGGGHTKAAGFGVPIDQRTSLNPYETFRVCLENYLDYKEREAYAKKADEAGRTPAIHVAMKETT